MGWVCGRLSNSGGSPLEAKLVSMWVIIKGKILE